MSLEEKYKLIHKSFRKYLREVRGFKGDHLNNIVKASDDYLTLIVRERIDRSFMSIYSDVYDLSYLLSLKSVLSVHEDWLVETHGYISLKALESYIDFYAYSNGIDLTHIETTNDQSQTVDSSDHNEGASIESRSIRYERDPQLRDDCIAKYGCKCFVCGFDFEKVYGEAGCGFIEVHHLTPLNVYGDSHIANVDDLRPLCSNCHSIIHRRRSIDDEPNRNYYTIEELKEIISHKA